MACLKSVIDRPASDRSASILILASIQLARACILCVGSTSANIPSASCAALSVSRHASPSPPSGGGSSCARRSITSRMR
eukprot:5108709-Pyramimonas_sp.AAC.1